MARHWHIEKNQPCIDTFERELANSLSGDHAAIAITSNEIRTVRLYLPNNLGRRSAVTLKGKERALIPGILWAHDGQVDLTGKVFRQPAKVKAFISVAGDAEEPLLSAFLPNRKSANLV